MGRIAGILLLLVTLLGCTPEPQPEVTKPEIRIGWSLWSGWYPMAIAIDQGLFVKHGVRVKPVLYTT